MAVLKDQGLIVRTLLLCGLVSSVFYIVIDVVGALSYPGYDYRAQAISEMSAIGAPTADLLAPLYASWSVLFVAFTLGVWLAGRSRPLLRTSAAFMLGVAIIGAGLSVYPMNERSAEPTFSDTMHLLFAGGTMLFLALAIITGGSAFGPRFRRYSGATVALMLFFFGLTMHDVPRIEAHLSTPDMGLFERISMLAWLLWIAALSLRLVKSRRAVARFEHLDTGRARASG